MITHLATFNKSIACRAKNPNYGGQPESAKVIALRLVNEGEMLANMDTYTQVLVVFPSSSHWLDLNTVKLQP
jgi:fructose-1,6-bisphosphatase/sedoheptulose 1,7-bisphosphatase-like protein